MYSISPSHVDISLIYHLNQLNRNTIQQQNYTSLYNYPPLNYVQDYLIWFTHTFLTIGTFLEDSIGTKIGNLLPECGEWETVSFRHVFFLLCTECWLDQLHLITQSDWVWQIISLNMAALTKDAFLASML